LEAGLESPFLNNNPIHLKTVDTQYVKKNMETEESTTAVLFETPNIDEI
jgi:hypothetical protein